MLTSWSNFLNVFFSTYMLEYNIQTNKYICIQGMRIQKYAVQQKQAEKRKDKSSKEGLKIEKETCRDLLQGFPFSCSKQN